MANGFVTVIKKIGDKVISVVEWPFKHAAMLEAVIGDGLKDIPQVKTAIVGLVETFGTVEPDFLAIAADKGLNLGDDLKGLKDVQVVFDYFKNTFLPVIEAAYGDLKKDIPSAAAPAPANTGIVPPAVAVGAGLHTTVAQ